MKKIIYIFTILGVSLLLLNSCRDEDKTLFSYGDDIIEGALVSFVDQPPLVIGVNAVSEVTFGGELVDPIGNVEQYTIELYASLSGEITDTILIGTFNTFPLTLNYTINDLVTFLNITVDDVNFGDSFYFLGTVTDNRGYVFYGEAPEIAEDSTWIPNGMTDIKVFDPTNGYKDGFRFDFTIGCPIDAITIENIVGTYSVISESFEHVEPGFEFDIIAGPGENQVTIIDMLGHGQLDGNDYTMVVDINSETGDAFVEGDVTWDSDNYGWGYGPVTLNGDGYVFPCVGIIQLNLTQCVSIGCFTAGCNIKAQRI